MGRGNSASSRNFFHSVGMKLFLIFLICIVGFVIFVGQFTLAKVKPVIKSNMANSSEQTMIQTAGKLSLMLHDYGQVTTELLSDQSFSNSLSNYIIYTKKKDTYSQYQAVSKITAKFNSLSSSHTDFEQIGFIPADKSIPVIMNDSSTVKNVQQSSWLEKLKQAQGKIVWLPTSSTGYITENSNKNVFACGRLFRDISSGVTLGYLVIEINQNAIKQELAAVQLGKTGTIDIIDQSHKIVAAADTKLIGKAYPYTAKGLGSKDSGFTTINSNGAHLVVYSKIAENGWSIVGSVMQSELYGKVSQISRMTWYIAAAAAVLAVIIALLIVRMIARPLMVLRNLMREGSQGNLSVRTSFRSKDEIGQLGQSFNQMMEQITLLVNQTRSSAKQVRETAGILKQSSSQTSTAAKEIALATEQIATGALDLATQSEKGNELTSQIGSQMEQVIGDNEKMRTRASDVQDSSDKGKQNMSHLNHQTGNTEEMFRSIVDKFGTLKESTDSIRNILEMLVGITKQTNILSLNASIEAARAGESGKGFMVVAQEIRKLADQSNQSIQVVGEITDKIQLEMEDTTKVLTDAYPLFQEQINSVKEVDAIFQAVDQNMNQFIQQLNEATNSITELNASQHTLSEAMSSVSAVAQQSTATSEEVASLSSNQTEVSDELVQLSSQLDELSQSLQASLAQFTTEQLADRDTSSKEADAAEASLDSEEI